MSEKIKDDKNRWRNKSVGFRVSPEEWDVINDKVRLCGYGKKQDCKAVRCNNCLYQQGWID